MLQKLFHREPEYDENGKIVGYKLPPIVWILIVGVFIYRVSKSGGQGGGGGLLDMLFGGEERRRRAQEDLLEAQSDEWKKDKANVGAIGAQEGPGGKIEPVFGPTQADPKTLVRPEPKKWWPQKYGGWVAFICLCAFFFVLGIVDWYFGEGKIIRAAVGKE